MSGPNSNLSIDSDSSKTVEPEEASLRSIGFSRSMLHHIQFSQNPAPFPKSPVCHVQSLCLSLIGKASYILLEFDWNDHTKSHRRNLVTIGYQHTHHFSPTIECNMIVTVPNQDCMLFPPHFADCLSGRLPGNVIENFAINCSSQSFGESKWGEGQHLCITSAAFILKRRSTVSQVNGKGYEGWRLRLEEDKTSSWW